MGIIFLFFSLDEPQINSLKMSTESMQGFHYLISSAFPLKITTIHATYLIYNHTELCLLQSERNWWKSFRDKLPPRLTRLSCRDSAHRRPISLPLWRVIQLPAVIQIITFTLMLSLSLTAPSAFLSVSCFLLYSLLVIENGQLSTLRHVLCGKQGEEKCISL